MFVNQNVIQCCIMFNRKEASAVPKTDSQIGLRVTSEFKARLEKQAERGRRSVSNLILKVMEGYLEQQEQDSRT